MKYFLFTLLFLAGMAGRAQMKGDTTRAESRFEDELFQNIVLLMQQNKELSDRLDRAENKIDSLSRQISAFYAEYANDIGILKEEIMALQRRPYLQLDTKASHPALLVLCPDGSCGIILRKF